MIRFLTIQQPNFKFVLLIFVLFRSAVVWCLRMALRLSHSFNETNAIVYSSKIQSFVFSLPFRKEFSFQK